MQVLKSKDRIRVQLPDLILFLHFQKSGVLFWYEIESDLPVTEDILHDALLRLCRAGHLRVDVLNGQPTYSLKGSLNVRRSA